MQAGLISASHLPPAAAPFALAAARSGHRSTAEPVVPTLPVRKLFGDAEGHIERRRAGLGTDFQTREDRRAGVPRRWTGRVFATSAYLSQAMAQGLDPLPEPRTPHRQGVAAYPSLTLSADIFPAGDRPALGGHLIDLLA